MPSQISPAALLNLRLRAQGLLPFEERPSGDPAAVVRALCAVQAQEAPSAALALRVRARGLTASEVETVRLEARSFVRTWAVRGTLHLVAAEDLGWMLELLGPRLLQGLRRRQAQLGLTEEILSGATRTLRELLGEQGSLTRAELAEELADRGFPTEGQATYHLIAQAGLRGVLVYGPDREGEPTYTLLEDWVPASATPAPQKPAAALARRYLAGHGPAGPEDLASWSGLTLRQARAAFETLGDELLEIESAGGPAWLPRAQASWLAEAETAEVVVHLIPAYDPYLLGYRGRELMVAPEHARRIHPGGGLLRPTLLVNGRAAGNWRLKRRRGGVDVLVEPFETLSAEVAAALAGEVQDVGCFLETDASLNLAR